MTTLVPTSPGTVALQNDWDAFTNQWLMNRRLSANTRDAYARDVTSWLSWCRRNELDPLVAKFTHVNAYARELEATIDPRSGKLLSPATVARKLSGLSSWYSFLVKLGVLLANPVAGADRPEVSRDHSGTVGLAEEEVDEMLDTAEADYGPSRVRNLAVVTLLAELGLRVGEVVDLDVTDLGEEAGRWVVRFVGKGGVQRRRGLTPLCVEAVQAYLAHRTEVEGAKPTAGPLFVSVTGQRLTRHRVFNLVRRYAQGAGVPSWNRISPHSLRHAFATASRAAGIPLEDVQDAMGHADPRTTRRYDRDRFNLDRDPAGVLTRQRAQRRARSRRGRAA